MGIDATEAAWRSAGSPAELRRVTSRGQAAAQGVAETSCAIACGVSAETPGFGTGRGLSLRLCAVTAPQRRLVIMLTEVVAFVPVTAVVICVLIGLGIRLAAERR